MAIATYKLWTGNRMIDKCEQMFLSPGLRRAETRWQR